MKKILSLLLAVVMVIGMFPAGAIFASAAETEVVFELGTNGSASHNDGSSATTYTETVDGYTLAITDGVKMSTGALDAQGNSCIKLGTSSKTGSFSIAVPNDVTSVVINVAGYKAKTVTVDINSESYTISTMSNNGEYTAITINTITTKTITLTTSTNYRAMVNSITFICGSETETTCEHANTSVAEAVAATCTTTGFTAGVYCNDCESYIEGHEIVAALGHTNDAGVVTAPTCTEDGYTTYTCTVCGSSAKSDWVDATGHTYVDGVCSCGVEKPANLDGKYYIAAIRSSGNYMYMTNDLGTASTQRYQIVDSGLTVLPESIETVVDAQVFELIASGDGYIIKTGDQYLGYTSGNSGTLVAETDAKVVTIENGGAEGSYSIHFAAAADDERYLALNNSSAFFAWYKGAGNQIQDLYLIPVSETAAACQHTNTTTEGKVDATCTTAGSTGTVVCSDCGTTVTEATEIAALGHTYENGSCTVCGEAEPAEDVKIVFELGDNGDAAHVDGDSATTYTETVNGYTLTLTDCTKMYTGAFDATGNSCIKLGTSSVVGGFSFTVPDDVTEVVISVAKYKAKATKVDVNGTEYTLTNSSDDGAYDEITVDTSTSKTVTVTTVSGACRAMVNSITFICSETDHTCVWGEGVVTTAATCTTDGVMTYTCTVDGCTKTEPIKATGHTYVYGESAITCSACDYSAAYTLTSLADARAAAIAAGTSNSASTYYIKGIVTYISDKNVYIEDATAGFLVYFTNADDAASLALGDEILVWDTVKTYNGLTETSGTASSEFVKVSSGNALPSQTITLAQLKSDTTNEYLCERVVIENVTMGVINSSGNTPLTDADGNSINIYKVSGLNEAINVNDVVTVTAIVSTYNAYQLLINPGTAAADVVEVEHHDEVVVETVDIATAKAGTAGEYYQVEGVVTFIDGRNVYIQDATGGIVVYLTATNSTAAIGDKIKAYGALKLYNGLIELEGIDQTNTEQFEVLSNGNTVDAQAVTAADIANDTTNEYLAEKVTLNNVYVSYSYGYSSSYKNVNYILKDGDATVVLYRVPAATEADVMAGGTIINVEAIVSAYVSEDTEGNGYQLRVVGSESITVVGACAHDTTELVNVSAATCTEAGYTGDTECVACGYYTARGEETAALGHSYDPATGVCSVCKTTGEMIAVYTSLTEYTTCATMYEALLAIEENGALYIKLLHNVKANDVEIYADLYIDMNGCDLTGNLVDNSDCTIYAFDSSTDAYTCGEDRGVFSCTVNGAAYKPEAVVKNATITGTVKRYMAIADGDGYSYHRYYMGITHMSLKPGTTSVGYKAIFAGDEMVQANVEAYGFKLQLQSEPVINATKSGSFVSGKAVTLRLDNYDVANHGTTPLTASVTLTLKDGSVIESASVTKTMKEMVEAVNDNFDNYNAAQQAAITDLVKNHYETMQSWNVAKIYTPSAEESTESTESGEA